MRRTKTFLNWTDQNIYLEDYTEFVDKK